MASKQVEMATSGPGAIHLLYGAKLDHVPVVAIVGQTNRSAMGGSYQQEVDLLSSCPNGALQHGDRPTGRRRRRTTPECARPRSC